MQRPLGRCIPEHPKVPNKPRLKSRGITKGLYDKTNVVFN